jgi:hypothetical protein
LFCIGVLAFFFWLDDTLLSPTLCPALTVVDCLPGWIGIVLVDEHAHLRLCFWSVDCYLLIRKQSEAI